MINDYKHLNIKEPKEHPILDKWVKFFEGLFVAACVASAMGGLYIGTVIMFSMGG